jgi:hypothetical protein
MIDGATVAAIVAHAECVSDNAAEKNKAVAGAEAAGGALRRSG